LLINKIVKCKIIIGWTDWYWRILDVFLELPVFITLFFPISQNIKISSQLGGMPFSGMLFEESKCEKDKVQVLKIK